MIVKIIDKVTYQGKDVDSEIFGELSASGSFEGITLFRIDNQPYYVIGKAPSVDSLEISTKGLVHIDNFKLFELRKF